MEIHSRIFDPATQLFSCPGGCGSCYFDDVCNSPEVIQRQLDKLAARSGISYQKSIVVPNQTNIEYSSVTR